MTAYAIANVGLLHDLKYATGDSPKNLEQVGDGQFYSAEAGLKGRIPVLEGLYLSGGVIASGVAYKVLQTHSDGSSENRAINRNAKGFIFGIAGGF